MNTTSRRQFVIQSGTLAIAGGLLPGHASAARSKGYGDEMPDMLLSYLSKKLNALAAHWDAERAAIRTPAQIAERNRFVRDKFREMVHGFPEPSPLNPVVVKSMERDGYRVENVMFQSRPDFWVTANLYIPTEGKGPFPGIISPCGHYPLARMQPDYQFVYLNLVKNGFVVLGYDPIGQGERRQYWDPNTGRADIADPVWEHSMPGQLLLLMGEDLTHYRIWDGIRAIDYLLTRPEVDPKRIGCAGHSGGGTLTMFISALDERIQCAVISQGGTGHRWPVRIKPGEKVGPSDVEQNLFPAAVYGIDLCDLHVAIAPRPLLALIEYYGPWFDEAARHIKSRYEQLGVPEKFATVEAGDPHAYTVKLRLATTGWFSRWFYGRNGLDREPEFEPAPAPGLYCTPNGSVRYSGLGDTIFTLIQQKSASLPPERSLPTSGAELEDYRRQLAEEIRQLLHFRKADGPLGVRLLETTQRKGYKIDKLEFLSEPGIYVPTWVFLPDHRGPDRRATLVVSDEGKEADGMEFGLLEGLARMGHLGVAVDVRGIGETTPPHCQDLIEPYEFRQLFDVETAMSYMAWYMSESLFGMRVQDVTRSVDCVLSRPDVDNTSVRVIGKGMGALWALFAAALDSRIGAVICENCLLSYRSLTVSDRYVYGANVLVRDVLKHFDLPHVAAAVAPRPLTLLAPLDHMKNLVDMAAAREVYAFARDAYARAGVAGRFRVLEREPGASPARQYIDLMQ